MKSTSKKRTIVYEKRYWKKGNYENLNSLEKHLVIPMLRKEYKKLFFENVIPTKLTEARRLKVHTEGWGLLTDYYLESVKINRLASGAVSSSATLKIGDRSGQITCVVKGLSVGLLFGLSMREWAVMEELCKCGQQLFYRYFRDGLSKNFRCEQKLFYNFCMSNQSSDVLVAIYRRCFNMRNKDKSDPLIKILELQKCDGQTLDLYVTHIREKSKIELNKNKSSNLIIH